MDTQNVTDLRIRIRRHASLFDTQRQAVIGTTVDGEIVYWNATAESIYGWRAEEAEGRSIVEVTPTDASRAEADEIMDRLRKGRSWTGEFMVRSKSGEEFHALVTDVPVIDDDGILVGMVGISSRS